MFNYPVFPRICVGAVVFKDNRVLLVKRKNPPSKGMWAIPGGRVELGESLKQAAQREIMEETGIHIQVDEPIYIFESIQKDEKGRIAFHYIIIDMVARYKKGNISPGDDALDARWISEDELKTLKVNQSTKDFLKEYFNFGRH